MSVVEAVTNTVGGFGVSLFAQVHLFPYYDIHIAMQSSAEIAAWMLLISLVR